MVLSTGYFLESYAETFRKYQCSDLLPRNSDSVGLRWIQALVVFKICLGDSNVWPGLRTAALKMSQVGGMTPCAAPENRIHVNGWMFLPQNIGILWWWTRREWEWSELVGGVWALVWLLYRC